ncbi:TetR/AcrR family transcriptional regulator [Paenibacillus shenyangensis]|uniref:TetR/AcrR family transcriptional regulator n=1 Tax=Paenibacillus sp. A9 TaxID=1284352 RepID=UPI0003757278|nr:TetR/AcrR family transcriptional regulator [Paenibacillus sp. A9]
MVVKTDLRIVRSRHSIRKAFAELLNEKGYDAITIQDIADRAMINRNTFYSHYQNKPELLNTCINELLENVGKAVMICPNDEMPVSLKRMETIAELILENISSHLYFYKALLTEEKQVHGFQTKMEEIIQSTMNEKWENHEISKDLLIQYTVSAFMGTVIWWIKNDLCLTPKQLASQFCRIFAYGHLYAAGIALTE